MKNWGNKNGQFERLIHIWSTSCPQPSTNTYRTIKIDNRFDEIKKKIIITQPQSNATISLVASSQSYHNYFGQNHELICTFSLDIPWKLWVNPLPPSDAVRKQKKNILKDLFSTVLTLFKKYHPSANMKFKNLGIFQSLKLRILVEKSFQYLLS